MCTLKSWRAYQQTDNEKGKQWKVQKEFHMTEGSEGLFKKHCLKCLFTDH